MKSIYRIAAVITFAAAAAVSMAQTLQSGYFDDNYLYRYQANPAFANERHGFVSMPALGNLNLATQGTIGLSDIFYSLNGKTTTLLNPGISASKALGGLKSHSRLGLNLNETVIAVGFKAFKGYNTLTVSARADINLGLPKELITLAKEGVTNRNYDLSDLGANGRAWAEIALNHSHAINSKLRIGASLKFLVGVGAIDANVKTADLRLDRDRFIGQVNADIRANISGFRYKTDYNSDTRRDWVNGAELNDFNPINGYGAAIDLGAVYKLNPDWEFSMALTDLGCISWKNDVVASTNGLQQVSTDALHFNVDNNTSFDEFKDNLSMLYQLNDNGDQGSRLTAMAATFTAGAKYTLPVWRKVHFGIMNTTRINDKWTWTEFRLSANLRPCRVFSLGINGALGTFGPSFGGIVNLNLPGFNLYLASDHVPGKLAKQFVPLNSNTNFNLGLNFPF